MKKMRLFITSLCFILCISIYFIVEICGNPLLGLNLITVDNHTSVYEVTEVYSNGWAYYKGIKKGDLLYCSDTDVHKLEMVDSIYLLNGKETIRLNVSYKEMPLRYIISNFASVAYFFICFGIVLFLFYKKRDKLEFETKILILFLLNTSLTYLSAGLSARDNLIGLILNSVTLLLCPVLFFHYLIIMFSRFNIKLVKNQFIKIYYFLSVLISFIDIIVYKFFYTKQSLALFAFLLFAIYILIFFLFNFRKHPYILNVKKIKVLFSCISLAFTPFIFLYLVPTVLGNSPIFSAETAAIFILTIPFSIIYVIINDAFYDFKYIFKKFLINSFFASFPVIGMFMFMKFQVKSQMPLSNLLLITFIITLATLIAKDLLKSNQFQNLYSFYKSITYVSNEIKDIVDFVNRLTKELKNMLNLNFVYYFEYCKRNNEIISDKEEVRKYGKVLNNIKIKNWDVGQIVGIDDGYLMLINQNSDSYFFIVLSYKKSQTKLNAQDIYWLKSMAFYFNLIIENSRLVKDILDELIDYRENHSSLTASRLLFTISEQERTKLSDDIHDSILQELISLQKQIESYSNMEKISYSNLIIIKEQIDKQISFIRDACYDLKPPFLKELGLVESINVLIEKFNDKNKTTIQFVSDIKVELGYEITIALFRIIQELLTNAEKHSQANYILISLNNESGNIKLLYEDDGIGIEIDNSLSMHKHYGLASIKERTKSFNGEFFISAEIGSGTIIRISFPHQYN